jgi:transcriptional regulator with XRE-family HTH domain
MARAKSQYPELYLRFGQLLAEEREARGLTQTAVAQRLSKPPSAVWKYENGELRLDMIEYLALARAIGFDPLDLMRKLMAEE